MKFMILFAAALSLIGCSAWPHAHDDLLKLQSSFRTFRAHVQPTNPTETAKVNEIGDNIQGALDNAEVLTR